MKKILMGGLFSVILIVMIPLAPAIQINAIENQIHEELNDLKTQEITPTDLPEKFPLLFAFVILITISRLYIGILILNLSTEYDDTAYWFEDPFEITRPMLFLLGMFQMARTFGWEYFWVYLSVILKWDWFEWPPY